MKKHIILILIIQTFILPLQCTEKQTRIDVLIEKSKTFVENIVDGAHETWDDVKEVYDEVHEEIVQKIEEHYEKIAAKINVKKYIIQQIGESEVTFFYINRKIQNHINEISPNIKSWLKGKQKDGIFFNQEEISEFLKLIENSTQKKIARKLIKKIHNTDTFKELMQNKNHEFKQVQFGLLFTFYANSLLNQYKNNIDDIYAGFAYAKLFLGFELKIFSLP